MKQPKTKIDNNYDYIEGIKCNLCHKNGRKNRNIRKEDKIYSKKRRRILNNMTKIEDYEQERKE